MGKVLWYSSQASLNIVKNDFSNTTIDIDDDIYWFAVNGTNNNSTNNVLYEKLPDSSNATITVWEIYRIHNSTPIVVLTFASFSKLFGWNIFANGEKWQRRRNLQVPEYLI